MQKLAPLLQAEDVDVLSSSLSSSLQEVVKVNSAMLKSAVSLIILSFIVSLLKFNTSKKQDDEKESYTAYNVKSRKISGFYITI